MGKSFKAAASVVLLAATAGGCMRFEWSPEPTPVVVARSPMRIWVPVGADSFVIIQGARIVDDTLTGLIEKSAPPGYPLVRYRAPVSEVPRVALEKVNTGYGARNVAGVGAAVFAIILAGTIVQVGR